MPPQWLFFNTFSCLPQQLEFAQLPYEMHAALNGNMQYVTVCSVYFAEG